MLDIFVRYMTIERLKRTFRRGETDSEEQFYTGDMSGVVSKAECCGNRRQRIDARVNND